MQHNNVFVDDRPIENLTSDERKERFKRQIGSDYFKENEKNKRILLKAYMLEEYLA